MFSKQILIQFILLVSISCNPIQFEEDLSIGSKCETSDGAVGICRLAKYCLSDSAKFRNRNICFFEKTEPVACCNVSNIIIDPEIFAEKRCDYSYPRDPPQFNVQAFAGGWRSVAGEHPHMAAIGWTETSNRFNWKCGGSLIREDFVITAAHCASDRGVQPDTVRLGDLNLLIEEEDLVVVDFKITEIFVHPDYKPPAIYNDIALLHVVSKSLEFVAIKSICLWPKSEIPTTDLLGMGYGTTSFAGEQSNELLQGNLSLVTNVQCNTQYDANFKTPHGLIDSQMCAHDPSRVRDTCQGDSGGPLQFTVDGGYSKKRPYLVGITSFGQFCAGPAPGVYTRISSYINWIADIVWPNDWDRSF